MMVLAAMTPLYYFADFILHDDRVNQYVGDDGSGGEKSSSVHESGFHDDGNPINISDCSKCLMTAKSAILPSEDTMRHYLLSYDLVQVFLDTK
jgi:hypothetical protein